MTIDIRDFFQATNPSRTLSIENEQDKKYYIDFSSVRGGKIIEEIKENIVFFSPDIPTCSLFTGHIGCGKSTELLHLKSDLIQAGFHVVYFESSQDLEMADVDVGDFLLAIARRVSQSLDTVILAEPKTLKALLKGAIAVLNTEINDVKLKLPGMPELGVSTDDERFSLSFGIGEITAKTKSDATLRERLNQYLGPQKTKLLAAINQELIEPAIAQLKQSGKRGLVVIVDNLDRVDSRPKPWGRPQQEYLYIDQSEYLTQLNCHLVYTMPLALKFSNDYNNLTQRFPEDPKVLPMVPVMTRDGQRFEPGIELLRQLVLARAFPDLSPWQRLRRVNELFDTSDSLDRLCCISGGHVRDLLRLLNNWIQRDRKLPLRGETLEALIRIRRNEMTLQISDDEWELLRQVKQRKTVRGDWEYQALIHSRLVFEYRNQFGESWFDLNPILNDAKELSS